MNARELRLEAVKVNRDKEQKQYDKIKSEIQRFAKLGKFEYHVYEHLEGLNELNLEEEGFMIQNTGMGRDGSPMIKISW